MFPSIIRYGFENQSFRKMRILYSNLCLLGCLFVSTCDLILSSISTFFFKLSKFAVNIKNSTIVDVCMIYRLTVKWPLNSQTNVSSKVSVCKVHVSHWLFALKSQIFNFKKSIFYLSFFGFKSTNKLTFVLKKLQISQV